MSQIVMYNTKIFTQIYENADDFIADYNTIGFPTTISEANARTLYYLLYSKFGNSPISNMDENQFKFKLFSIVWQYGPTWEKKLEIQGVLRALNEEDLRDGGISISNHAYNPSTEPSTTSDEILTYINEQNVNKVKGKNKVAAYMLLWQALAEDITRAFLDRFNICFKQFVGYERPILYVSDEEE